MKMDEGLQNLISKAENGDIEAIVMVADCYNRGFHVKQSNRQSHIWYKKAADLGHAGAAFMVGLDYQNGIGTIKNIPLAVKYIQVASDKGIAGAQYVLGLHYLKGNVGWNLQTTRNRKAVELFQLAAQQGLADAQIMLGKAYIAGEWIAYDLDQGLFWLACAFLHGKGAQQQSDQALNHLNSILKIGLDGGKARIESLMDRIRKDYPQYLVEPKP